MSNNVPERIKVKKGNPAYFVKKNSGESFLPIGGNLIRLDNSEHANFVSDVYDKERTEKVLDLMNEYNFNTVRLFIAGRYPEQTGIAGKLDTTIGLDKEYMDNVVDFIKRAAEHGIYIIVTMIYIPINKYFIFLEG